MSTVLPRELRVSHSEVDSWLLCRRKHYYGYYLGLTRTDRSAALGMGIVGHDILNELFQDLMEEPHLDKMAYLKNQLGNRYVTGEIEHENLPKLTRMIEAFVDEWPFDGWKIMATEKEYVYKIDDGLYFPFVVDLIMRDPWGKYVVIDHKFTKDFYKPWNIDILPQIPKYIAALRAMGKPVDYGAYSIFRTGYAQKAESDNIYKLMPTLYSDTRVKITEEEQIGAAVDIQAFKKLPQEEASEKAYRIGNNLVCNSCSFKSICVAELNGHATGPLLKTEYTQKEEREFRVE